MKTSELRQIIREELSKHNLNENISVDTIDDSQPGMSLSEKDINGITTTMVKVENYFMFDGEIKNKKVFLDKIQKGFSKVWLNALEQDR